MAGWQSFRPIRYACASLWTSRLAPVHLLATLTLALFAFASPASAGTLTVTWSPNPETNVIGYKVSWGTASGVRPQIVDVGAKTSFAFVPPDLTHTYFFAVQAYNTNGLLSASSSEVSWNGSTASTVGTGSTGVDLSISWNPNPESDVAGYKVSWGYSTGNYGTTVDVGNQTQYNFVPPDPTQQYHFGIQAYDSAGLQSPYSSDVVWTPTVSGPPTATTGNATVITANGATLNGTVNPMGSTVTASFQYGRTTTYGSATQLFNLGAGTQNVSVGNGTIGGLACNTLYHFRVTASSSLGTANGADASFTTAKCAAGATVVTGTATAIGTATATLNGTVNPNGTSSTASFEYGSTTAYGSTTSAVSVGSGTSAVAIGGGVISGLSCDTVYHFRAVAVSNGVTTSGSDASFATTACAPPTVTTGVASTIGATTATLNGTANPSGTAASGFFEYGPTTSYGNSTSPAGLGSGTSAVAIGNGNIASLQCNAVYHFRAVVTSAGGTVRGSDATFRTTACLPTVVTGAATSVTRKSVVLNATVNPNGSSTSGSFRFGPSQYVSTTKTISVGSGSSNVAISQQLQNLQCGTQYHFTATMTNAGGSAMGADVTFTTASCR